VAKSKNLQLYDIMTERYEITTILQRELSMIPEIFGKLEKGSLENPAVTKESVHHFYKYVSGSVLMRPPWFYDVEQEGEGLTDVMTHLVDMVQWECFPGKIIDIEKDIRIDKAKRFPTLIKQSQFFESTGTKEFPSYLLKDALNDTSLNVYCNGEINYTIKGVHAKVSVQWAFKAPEGTGDTHYSVMRGSKASLEIRQGKEQDYKPVLYIVPVKNSADFENQLTKSFKEISNKYPGVEIKKLDKEWMVIVPEKYKEGHEAHFARVMEKYIDYFNNKNMPAWEVPNMLTKYYITTKALEMARKLDNH
jgi:predicted dehydrogenase